MLDRSDEEKRVLACQIGAVTLISAASLACRVLMVRWAGLNAVVVGFDATLSCIAICALAAPLAIVKGYGRVATAAFGVSVFFMTFTYLFDAVEAAIHLGRASPLADAVLSEADRVLGFDWLGYARWMDRHPLLWDAGREAYLSMPILALLVIAALAWTNRSERLAAYLLVQITCLGLVACIGAMTPAVGTYDFYRAASAGFMHRDFVTADHMTTSLAWLRQDQLIGNGVEYHGLISFPSYHAMSCVIYAWALWPFRWLRWPTVALTTLILVATPVQGSHYLVDVIAGLVIAGLVIKPCQIVVALLSRPAKARSLAFALPEASSPLGAGKLS